jgi:hypothetical protein
MTMTRMLTAGSICASVLCSLASCVTAMDDEPVLAEDVAASTVPPQLIAAGQNAPVSVQVDSARAYWVNSRVFEGEPGDIRFAPKVGGGLVRDFEQKILDIGFIALDDKRVYWTQGGADPGIGGIRSKSKIGGAPVDLVANRRVFAMALADTQIYFASPDNGGQILRVSDSGGALTVLASNVEPGLDNTPLVAIGGDKVFFTQSEFDVDCQGLVRYVPRNGGTVKNIAKEVCGLLGLAADSTAVYWTEFDSEAGVGRVMKQNAPFTGTAIVLDQLAIRPTFLTVDGGSLYYAAGGPGDSGIIVRIPKTGIGLRRTLAVDQQFPVSPTVDGTHVYWATLLDGEVKRTPK